MLLLTDPMLDADVRCAPQRYDDLIDDLLVDDLLLSAARALGVTK